MMQFTIDRTKLLKALQCVVGVVETRQTRPILSHVLLDLQNKTLTLTGTDNEISITSYAEVEESGNMGQITLPAHTLLEICRRLPDETMIGFKQQNNQVLIQAGHSSFRLMSLMPQEFPHAVFSEGACQFSVPENKLYEAIKGTRFAMAHQDVRYYLNGMLWDIKAGKFQVVATDGHRLASKFTEIDVNQSSSVIVPRKTILELSRLLTESDAPIQISFSETQVSIQGAYYCMVSRLIGGHFPDYTQLIPKEPSPRIAIIDRDQLKDALSRQGILLKGKKHKGIRLEFTENTLKLFASNVAQESGEDQLPVEYRAQESEPFCIAFNIDYLEEVLDVLPSGKVKFILPQQEGVTLLEQLGGTHHIYMIMPMRL
jgi:DNA polymerase-3 subunit beta